ncbi:probable ATP-dependent RNA helicase DDX60 [Nilaparvata lugens]|uniref:probable ATP-dependent RNA helicase DDX60 n=1 Tax=Nilaparvata lugens TaxID=108931 RepID=UPI00193C8FD1|nr:probable ATP-dependent RNA helicase DDX60 [Nilaparvata lugens]
MDMYGSNLEGKTLERRAIICENPPKKPQKNQKTQKKDKISKTAAKLIEDNNLKKEKKLQEEENAIYSNFKKQFKQNSTAGKSYTVNLALINHVLSTMKTDLYYGKMIIYKVDVLFYLWEEVCKDCKTREERDVSYLKELFLAIRDLMSCAQKEPSLLGEKERAKLGKKICQLGFKELAEKCSLPVTDGGNSDVSVDQSCVRFQMTHLGPELLRKIDGGVDLRVEGFIPDQWQRDMFDAIDKRQSALIVAPTSSGKTYASYYCMEKVLRESNDGKVVYVAPTKALVNQVAATVYSRFKGKAGIVYGILTKDYRVNAFDCQILVTVPECLEALFMSPEYHSWTKQLRYAIFDEVHCLTNFENGITWERCLMMMPCPFLALSATIQNPDSFHSWMQKFERFKKELDPEFGSRVVLIVHSERHNDLVKHMYETNKGLCHIHPVSHLTNRVMNAHQGIPKHIYLAPGEMIELYDMLVKVAGKDDPHLKDLEPETYFAQFESGFVFRNDAKKYEAKLRQVLEDWFTNKRELFDKIVTLFRAQISDFESSNKRLVQFMSSIKGFVELLKGKGMLPAIVFSYDREKCEILGEYVTDSYKEEEEKNAPKTKKKQIAVVDDDDDFDDREERPLRKNKVKATSGKKEEHRRKLGEVEMNPVGLTECDIQYSVRSVVSLSMKDLQFIEGRLFRKGLKKKSPAIEMFRRGVGVHHAGLPTIVRNTAEMLFRMKFLNVIFATGTLALGVHMPCKTVVILGDSPLLNTLEFHQISGRAGRRGFDKTGDVIFFGLDSKKVQSLQTSKLPKINGNYPLTVTTVLRFFCLYSLVKGENEEKEKKLVLNRILTVLNESLLYQAYPDLRTQMKYYFGYSCHLLMSLGLLHAESGRIHLLTHLINIVHHHEEGILAFAYLLKSGFFHSLCKLDENHDVSEESCDTIMLILCYLFTNIPFSKHQVTTDENDKTVDDIKLPSLPSDAVKALQSYNNIVKRSFTKYYKNVAKFNVEKFGKDEKLPISRKMFKGRCSAGDLDKDGANLESMLAGNSVSNSVCSVFAGLSGQTDDDLFIENVIIGNVREEVFSNYKCVPLVELDVPLNSFAYNFYKHGIIRPIIRDHHLKPGQDYTCILDFHSVLKNIKTSLEKLQWVNEDGKDCLFGIRRTFSHIANTFDDLYQRAYHEGGKASG